LTDALPLGSDRTWNAGAKGQAYSKDQPPPPAFVRIVSDGYLRAMGIPLRAGRDFTENDTVSAQPVILINETLARTLWPGRNPIGQTVTYVDVDRQVIGVVGDVRHTALEQTSGCEMYLPIRQTNDYASVDLVVRTALPPSALASGVRAALKPVEPNLPANEFRTLSLETPPACGRLEVFWCGRERSMRRLPVACRVRQLSAAMRVALVRFAWFQSEQRHGLHTLGPW
jgi:hypothetical protein